jgi:hypothetical protein
MANELEITHIDLSPLEIVNKEEYITIKITIKNSSTTIQHVISTLTNIQYDQEKKTLFIGLVNEQPLSDEKAMELGFISNHKFTPETTPIEPNEAKTISFSIPTQIKQILPPKLIKTISFSIPTQIKQNLPKDYIPMIGTLKTFDISDLKHIICKLSYDKISTKSFDPTFSDFKMIYPQKWGETVKKKLDIRIPKK